MNEEKIKLLKEYGVNRISLGVQSLDDNILKELNRHHNKDMVIEVINTAIEATVDMVTKEYNEYAKIAKDCGSAATGIMGVLATIVNLIIKRGICI